MKHFALLALGLAMPLMSMGETLTGNAPEGEKTSTPQKAEVDYRPEIHGTIRGKYEYQPDMNAGRFEVRNARFSLSGKVAPRVNYKAEIDLCDEGKIKMLDAYTRITPFDDFNFTIGQMRVPFTIDAHRSPHQQYFANRSFIAKQVGNVRDVGVTLAYTVNAGQVPIIMQAGVYNGSGLTNQKDYWTNSINYSAKVEFKLPKGFNVVVSGQKVRPEATDVETEEVTKMTDVNMFDGGINYSTKRWHIEAEYLYKHYSKNAFEDVNAVDAFVCYNLPLKKAFNKISFLARYDYMGDHSNGEEFYNATGLLKKSDNERSRVTGGITLSIAKPFISDIRINYEKYFYNSGATPKKSEQDKFVIEFMTRF